MKVEFLIANLFAIICGIGAIIILLNGKDGWGWFLFVGMISGVTISKSRKKGGKNGK